MNIRLHLPLKLCIRFHLRRCIFHFRGCRFLRRQFSSRLRRMLPALHFLVLDQIVCAGIHRSCVFACMHTPRWWSPHLSHFIFGLRFRVHLRNHYFPAFVSRPYISRALCRHGAFDPHLVTSHSALTHILLSLPPFYTAFCVTFLVTLLFASPPLPVACSSFLIFAILFSSHAYISHAVSDPLLRILTI